MPGSTENPNTRFCWFIQHNTPILTVNMEETKKEFGTYARFHTMDEAGALVLLLESNHIPYSISNEVNQLDSLIIGDSMDPMIIVAIHPENFREVNQLVASSIEGITPELAIDQSQEYENMDESKQESLDPQWILLGYLFSLFSIVGIFIGLTIMHSSRRLRSGERIKIYDARSIRHGRIMLIIGILTTIWLIWRKFISVFMLR